MVGAGIFGTWTALRLQQAGLSTVLVDAWGVAHPRASSSGESRIIRTGYGRQSGLYTAWAWRALEHWQALEQKTGTLVFVPCGVLWLGRRGDVELNEGRRAMAKTGVPHEQLNQRRLKRRFAGLGLDGVETALWEPACGALLARRACRLVAQSFLDAGGSFQFGKVLPPESGKQQIRRLKLESGAEIEAQRIVFCPGPWMDRLFGDLVSNHFAATRQEVFFFGPPAGDQTYFPDHFPAWIDLSGDEIFYGLPAIDGRGVKVACDARGPSFDPTDGSRNPSEDELYKVRALLAKRLPELADAPLLESRVCQYEQTSDSHLIIDRHPRYRNLWLAGGGSGHGFKLGPVVGEQVAELVLQPEAQPPPELSLNRFRSNK